MTTNKTSAPHPQLRQIESLFGSSAAAVAPDGVSSTVIAEETIITPSGETVTRSRRSTESPEVTTIVEQSTVRDAGCDVHGAAVKRRNSLKRRDSLGRPGSIAGDASSLRRDSKSTPAPAIDDAANDSPPVPTPRRKDKLQRNTATATSPPARNSTAIGDLVPKRTPFGAYDAKPVNGTPSTAAGIPRSASAYTLNRAAYLRLQQREALDRAAALNPAHRTGGASSLQRRQSLTPGSRAESTRNGLASPRHTVQHPSAFPSMLRGSYASGSGAPTTTQSSWDVRGIRRPAHSPATATSPLSASAKSVSSVNLRRRDSLSTTQPQRSPRDPLDRVQSTAAARLRADSAEPRSPADLRKASFGGSLYMRPDAGTSTSSLARRDSFGSRRDSLNSNGAAVFIRADSAGNANLVRRDRHAAGSQALRRDSLNNGLGSNRSIVTVLANGTPANASSLLRRDSFASSQSLLQVGGGSRRDSNASTLARASVPRDYVSQQPCAIRGHTGNGDAVDGPTETARRKPANSILRKDSFKASKKHVSYEDDVDTVDAATIVKAKTGNSPRPANNVPAKVKQLFAEITHQLTADNLSKHSTILEESIKNERNKELNAKHSIDDTAIMINGVLGGSTVEQSSRQSTPMRQRTNSTGSAGSGAYQGGRRISMDSLDVRRNSWTRRGSQASEAATIVDGDFEKSVNAQNDPNRPRFVPVTALEDVQAVRCAEFHPNGKVYSVGSNSKTFRICEYPSLADISETHTTYQPTVLFKRTKHHKGSIYCMAWSPQGDLVATGSNDKTVKLMRYNEVQQQLEGKETELTMHDGTVRDLCFLEDSTNKASLLISGGAGDCKVYVTDCATATPFQALSGHGGHILSLYNWGGAMFVSGSQDKTVRFWDLRTRGCVNTVTPATVPGSRQGSPVAAVCVDPSGRLLVSGHEDSSCVLYDIRGNRPTQCFKPHATDVRSIRFSPSAYYLLTAGYDNKLVLTDLQGDLTMPLPSVVVAQHQDKVISGRWHPTDFSFLSTSADKTATLWALPPI